MYIVSTTGLILFLTPTPAYPAMMGEGPQVIVAEDDGMEVEATTVPEEEEVEEAEPFKDDQGDGVSDVEIDPEA
jgi:hypothetical protein